MIKACKERVAGGTTRRTVFNHVLGRRICIGPDSSEIAFGEGTTFNEISFDRLRLF